MSSGQTREACPPSLIAAIWYFRLTAPPPGPWARCVPRLRIFKKSERKNTTYITYYISVTPVGSRAPGKSNANSSASRHKEKGHRHPTVVLCCQASWFSGYFECWIVDGDYARESRYWVRALSWALHCVQIQALSACPLCR